MLIPIAHLIYQLGSNFLPGMTILLPIFSHYHKILLTSIYLVTIVTLIIRSAMGISQKYWYQLSTSRLILFFLLSFHEFKNWD